MQEVDQFEHWWPWLEDFRLDGDTLPSGCPFVHRGGRPAAALPDADPGRVDPVRAAHRNRCRSSTVIWKVGRVSRCAPGEVGDPSRRSLDVEMMQRPMRLASRFAHPLLQWGHDRVVEVTVAGFRRRARVGQLTETSYGQ